MNAAPVAAVGVACFKGAAVLLIRRGKPPLMGRWSLPGGRIAWGERAEDAAQRELMEETGCSAEIVGLVDVVDAILSHRHGESGPASPPPPWGHYVLIDYVALWRWGAPRAGDDALEARFFAPEELPSLGLWSETLRVIEAARRRISG